MTHASVDQQVSLADKSAVPAEDSSKAPFLFLFLEIFSQEGGIQSYVKDILKGYGQLNDCPPSDIFLLRDRPDSDSSTEAPNITFHYFDLGLPRVGLLLGRIHFTVAFCLYLLRRRPQHVFCGHILLAPLVQRLCCWFKVPYTILTYGKEVWEPLAPIYQKALQQADSVWTISRYTGDRLCSSNQVSSNKLRFLPCAIDEAYFTPGERPLHLFERYHIGSDAKVMVTVARLWSGDIYKGVDITIRALPQIKSVIPNIQYLVIGRGDDQPRLARLAQSLGVEDHVIFAGFVPTAELRDHYRLADAYVMPSQEGFGIVYLEAMTCGIPVISGDDDGSADPLQDGRMGWQVPHRDPQAVATACIDLLRGTDSRCNGSWLRQEAIAAFGTKAFQRTLKSLLLSEYSGVQTH